MNNFKIGDKIRIKKLSEQEFIEIYHKKHKGNIPYINYLNYYKDYFNKIFEIEEIFYHVVYCKKCDFYFYKEEIEKINHLKTKFKIVNKLLDNKRRK